MNVEWVENALYKAKEIMTSEASPDYRHECEHWVWYENVNKAMTVNAINEILPFLTKEMV